MRSIIILKGLEKSRKLEWVRREKLENFLIDIDEIYKSYSIPELIKPGVEVVVNSYGDLVYRRLIEIICTRMSRGSLIVLDMGTENCNFLDSLSLIFGYHIFYVVQDIRKSNYIKEYNKINNQCKSKDFLGNKINEFYNQEFKFGTRINSLRDVRNFWNREEEKKKLIHTIHKKTRILHVSDIHSNYRLYKELPDTGYDLRIFYGDYIDGPEEGGSRKVMEDILWGNNKNTLFLEGNHELRLRKLLGYKLLGDKKKDLKQYLISGLPGEFLNKTALEFSDIDPKNALEWLKQMNYKLKLFVELISENSSFICTHGGLKFFEQLDPRYIGSILYGHRNMAGIDQAFSRKYGSRGIWSIHAHCKYNDFWNPRKFKNVINIDPKEDTGLVLAKQTHIKNFSIWQQT